MHVIDDEDIKEADAAAEELHKQQHFKLWPDGPDPNLFGLGIYSFDIAMTLFLGAVKATYLPERQADTCIVDITSTYLQVRSRTKTRDCEITARAPLQSNSQIGDTGVSFEINKKVLRAICEAYKPYTLQMTYNSPEKSLSWSLSERDPRRGMTKIQVLHINVPVAAASSETGTPSCSAYSLPNRQKLYDAAEYLGILGKQQYEQSPISGVQFADGFLYGGHIGGVSRVALDGLPPEWIHIPRQIITNFLAGLWRLKNDLLCETEPKLIRISSESMSFTWTRDANWPRLPQKIFALEGMQTIKVSKKMLWKALTNGSLDRSVKHVTLSIGYEHDSKQLIVEGMNETRSFKFRNIVFDDDSFCESVDEKSGISIPRARYRIHDLIQIVEGEKSLRLELGLRDDAIIIQRSQEFGGGRTVLLVDKNG